MHVHRLAAVLLVPVFAVLLIPVFDEGESHHAHSEHLTLILEPRWQSLDEVLLELSRESQKYLRAPPPPLGLSQL